MRFYAEAGSPLPDSLFIMCRWTSLRRGDHAIADAVGGAVRRRHLPGAGLGARGAGRGARGRQSGDRQRAQRARASARPALHDRHRQPAGQRGRLPYPAGRRQRHRRHHRRATGAEPGRAAILGHRRRRLHGALRPRRRRAARLRQPRDRARGCAARPLPARGQAAVVCRIGQQRPRGRHAGPVARPGAGASPARQAAMAGPVRAGHRDGRAGVRRVAAPARVHRRRQGAGGAARGGALLLRPRRAGLAGRPPAAESRVRGHAAQHRARGGRCLLPRADRARHRGGGACPSHAGRPGRGRLGRLPGRGARACVWPVPGLPPVRRAAAEQRPAGGAADAGRTGTVPAGAHASRQCRGRALFFRGRAAGLRRPRLLRGRSGLCRCSGAGAARSRLPAPARRADPPRPQHEDGPAGRSAGAAGRTRARRRHRGALDQPPGGGGCRGQRGFHDVHHRGRVRQQDLRARFPAQQRDDGLLVLLPRSGRAAGRQPGRAGQAAAQLDGAHDRVSRRQARAGAGFARRQRHHQLRGQDAGRRARLEAGRAAGDRAAQPGQPQQGNRARARHGAGSAGPGAAAHGP
ncbi:Uncharacterised protein [Bordetella pertussis]|nr:Uncharacterised protein [Bordetella pertussis]CPM39718.1 Uncharacterised protein [Bordetella pertussis]